MFKVQTRRCWGTRLVFKTTSLHLLRLLPPLSLCLVISTSHILSTKRDVTDPLVTRKLSCYRAFSSIPAGPYTACQFGNENNLKSVSTFSPNTALKQSCFGGLNPPVSLLQALVGASQSVGLNQQHTSHLCSLLGTFCSLAQLVGHGAKLPQVWNSETWAA